MKDSLIGAVKSKSIWLGTTLVVLGALQANIQLLSNVLTAQQLGVATSVVGLIVIVLRAVTDQSLAERGDPKL